MNFKIKHVEVQTMFYIKNQRYLVTKCIPIIRPNFQQKINYLTDGLGKRNFNYLKGRINNLN